MDPRNWPGLVLALSATLCFSVHAQEAPGLLKKEVKENFKLGRVETEIWAETVTLSPVTEWNDTTLPDEDVYEDLLLPVKISSFRMTESPAWELTLAVFPCFNSFESRIPGPAPEFYGEPMRALITTPLTREVTLKGTINGERFASIFKPGMVYAAGFLEGKILHLRLGGIYPPIVQTSRLSPPVFNRGEFLSFAFAATRLHEEAVVFSILPDRIVGDDYTNYKMIAKMGAPFHEYETADDHKEWSLIVDSDQAIQVVAPLWDGRGAGGMLELEDLDLGPSYEEDVKALQNLDQLTPPNLSGTEDGLWQEILKHKLGEIPAGQRGREDANMDFTP